MSEKKSAAEPSFSPQEKGEAAAEWVRRDSLKPWARNPRKNDKAVPKVAASIKRFGFGAPILARRADREVIAGHTRLLAAESLGIEMVPVRFLDLDPADAHLLALADNKLNEKAEWDDAAVASLLSDYALDDADLAGWDAAELDKIGSLLGGDRPSSGDDDPETVSRADELQAKWQTATGQIWVIPSHNTPGGQHMIACGDSTLESDVAALMGTVRADLMWTDPPYGVSYVGKTKDALKIENDDLTGDQLKDFLSRCFAAAERCALKPGAAVYIAHPAGALCLQFMLAFVGAGWRTHQTLIWKKSCFALGHSDYHYSHEPILYGYVPGGGRRGRGGSGWYGNNAQSSVFEVDKPSSNKEHPTMKPVELVDKMVRNSCPPGGLVFEPFSGSGTTLVASEGAGRLCRAIEKDPKYVAVALERMASLGLKPEQA